MPVGCRDRRADDHTLAMSYQFEVKDEYSGDRWISNGPCFATEEEAIAACNLIPGAGWSGIHDSRVVPSDDPVNARWAGDKVESLDTDGQPIRQQPPSREEILESNHAYLLRSMPWL